MIEIAAMRMSRRALLLGALALAACGEAVAAQTIAVAKTPACGCCTQWVEHLRAAGFVVEVTDMDDVTPVARRLGVPDDLRGCHTASVGGYAVEGHVPAADIRRLLTERPDAAGIAVPGMPVGSPGMEQGAMRQRYQTIIFARDGRRAVFASH